MKITLNFEHDDISGSYYIVEKKNDVTIIVYGCCHNLCHPFSVIVLSLHMNCFYYSEVVVLSHLLINYIVYLLFIFLRFLCLYIFKNFVTTLDEIKQNGLWCGS